MRQAGGFGRKGLGANTQGAVPMRGFGQGADATLPPPDPFRAQREAFIASERAARIDLTPTSRARRLSPAEAAQPFADPGRGGFLSDAARAYEATPSRGKSLIVAYLLWLFGGMVAGHRLYVGAYGSAAIQSLLGFAWIGLFLAGKTHFIAALVCMMIFGIWRIGDLFLIPGMCRNAGA